MVTYDIVKLVHVTCVCLSVSGFVLRGIWLIVQSDLLQHKLTKRLPHVIDSLLLASALTLVFMSSQYPHEHAWLATKLAALLAYIGLGMVALRFGKTRKLRITAWLMALLVFAYIVLVALTRNPLILV